MPGSERSLYVEDTPGIQALMPRLVGTEGRPPDHTGSIQASGTATAVTFRPFLGHSSAKTIGGPVIFLNRSGGSVNVDRNCCK